MLQLVFGQSCGRSLSGWRVLVSIIDTGPFTMFLKQDELLRQVRCHCRRYSRIHRSLSIGGLFWAALRQLHH